MGARRRGGGGRGGCVTCCVLCRYETFVSLQQGRSAGRLRAPCDIDLVRRAHACMTSRERAQLKPHLREAVSAHGPSARSGSFSRSGGSRRRANGHSGAAECAELDSTTRGAFAGAGEELFRAGGMFRGIPARQSARLQEECLPGAGVPIAHMHVRCWVLIETSRRQACMSPMRTAHAAVLPQFAARMFEGT